MSFVVICLGLLKFNLYINCIIFSIYNISKPNRKDQFDNCIQNEIVTSEKCINLIYSSNVPVK